MSCLADFICLIYLTLSMRETGGNLSRSSRNRTSTTVLSSSPPLLPTPVLRARFKSLLVMLMAMGEMR